MDGAHWLRQPIIREHRWGIQLMIGPVPESGLPQLSLPQGQHAY